MSLPTPHAQTPLSLPFGQQVYTHPMPDTQTCRSFWNQPTCTCGQCALTWEMKAAAWPGFGSRALDLTLVPDNQGIIAILADAIDGPYRFAHHALNPYVTVWPATETEPITVRATRRLSLQGRARTRQLQGGDATMTLAVIFDGPDERLVEVSHPTDVIWAPRQPSGPRTIGTVPVAAPAPVVQPPARMPSKTRLVMAPDVPPDVAAPLPEVLAAICAKADVHPELGDYVVIPPSSVPAIARVPRWVVRSPLVDHIRIHKPRLDQVYRFGEEP